MERSSSMLKAKCQLETLVKNKLEELHKLGYSKLQSFEKLLAHIAPENVNISLKEIEIAGAMQLFNLERAYAVNALTISNELISLRRNHGMDMLQALDLLQQRVSSMRSVPYKPPAPRRPSSAPLGASAGGAPVGAGAGRAQRQLADEDCHVEKRRRLSKHACSGHGSGPGGSAALAAMAAMAAAAAVAAGGGGAPAVAGSGNEENELRPEKRPSSGSGGGGGGGAGAAGGGAAAAAAAAAVAEDMADFKRARKER